MQATVGASAITLVGLLKHLTHVDDSYFARLWLGSSVGAPLGCRRLEQLPGLRSVPMPPADGEHPDLRRVLLDLIEEYARHVGHACG